MSHSARAEELSKYIALLKIDLMSYLLEIIYEVTFYVPRDWLNQSRATNNISVVPPHVRAFFKLTSLFPFWHQRCNTESWLLTKQATRPCGVTYAVGHPMRDSTHMWTQNSRSSSLWICMDQPPKLYGTVTKTNAIVKSAENHLFLQLFSFSSFVYLFLWI